MQHISFDFIGRSPQHIPTVAQWHQSEWQHISPHLSTKLRIATYSNYLSQPTIPCCILATDGNTPLGSVSLVQSDMETRPELSPWLASLFVHPDWRQQGIATQLILHIQAIAKLCNIKRLYLFTPDQQEFYARRGWHQFEHYLYHGEEVDIMYYDLSEAT